MMRQVRYLGLVAACLLAGCVLADESAVRVERFATNPLITVATPGAGSNVCGPSVIRVPDWVENPLGTYYMYFARHMSSNLDGAYIRLAYADSPEGPWRVHKPGCLKRSQLRDIARDQAAGKKIRVKQHIASPDAHVDHEAQRIILYFHGSYCGHNTGAAASKNGIDFEDTDVNLGPAYLRMFRHKGDLYGLTMGAPKGDGSALIRKFQGPFSVSNDPGIGVIPAVDGAILRHAGLLVRDNQLTVFYSRIGDTPERIVAATIKLTDDWKAWTASAPVEVLRPEHSYEGSELTVQTSKRGTGRNKHELRDPCVFVDTDGTTYLYYTVKGESGIAGGRLTLARDTSQP